MHTWHWQTWEDLTYLTCSLLQPWPHGFFTQRCWPRSPQELVAALEPEATVYRVRQVHGNQVLKASEIEDHWQQHQPETAIAAADPPLPAADGLLTEAEQQAIWVCSADCTPVLIADARTGQVAAIHAGWRGTAAQIVPHAIARLQAQGSQLADLRVAMGPAIAGEVYQVGIDVAVKVGTTVVEPELAAQLDLHQAPETLLEILLQLSDPPIQHDPEPGKVRLDVRRINTLQLQQLGLQPEQIAIAPHCTYQEPEHFFSYRRDCRKQVQWSGIVSRAELPDDDDR